MRNSAASAEMIELYRAALALALSDVPDTVQHAQRALDLSPDEDHLLRAAAAGLLGLAYWANGDLEAGHAAVCRMHGGAVPGRVCLRHLRVCDRAGGYPAGARSSGRGYAHLRAGGAAGDRTGWDRLRGTADMYVGMSEVLRERNDLPAATRHLLRSQELGEHIGLPQNPYRWRVAMARIREAEGDLGGALDLLDEAERRIRQ